eukprot:comp8039_c1_seq1/m.3543 comp8039_c1_seq1/g.3543  ORF comp8039_c1_seq1/g.3543 comp8039_c1_seq1/m.3543 type:complete len:200 (-) comp8039_c1_seq1:77-676(-)
MRALSLLLCAAGAHAISHMVTVDANDELCFFEELHAGQPLGVTYQVTEGGFLDIDVQIKGPDGNVIHEIARSTEDTAAIKATKDGRHQICFSNQMSTMTPKELMFSINSLNQPEAPAEANTAEEHKQINNMVHDLSNKMYTVREENAYMAMREISHRQINESTHSRVLYWAIFECAVVVAMSIGQVVYLKRFFEQKRMV